MTIDPLFLIIILLIFILALLAYSLYRNQQGDRSFQILSEWLSEMRSGLDHQTTQVQSFLLQSDQRLSSRLEESSRLMRLLNHDIGQVKEIGQQISDFQKFLRSPKLRGVIAEDLLKDLLLQVIPQAHLRWQHRFKSGQIVDALILTHNGNIAIDSKFPLDNFLKMTQESENEIHRKNFYRDVRQHIKSVGQKYIVPQEGTFDFALLYIPSENIYYEILSSQELLNSATENKVLLISPHTLFYILRIILMGMESQNIQTRARELVQELQGLQQEAKSIQSDLGTAIQHIGNAKNVLTRVSNGVENFLGKIQNLKQ